LEIDNNAAERAMQPLSLGGKNYLFAGSDDGGQRAAAIYGLIERKDEWRRCRSLAARRARPVATHPNVPQGHRRITFAGAIPEGIEETDTAFACLCNGLRLNAG
jgi:hypothetical protein